MKKFSWYYKFIIYNLKKKINIDKTFLNYNSLDNLFNYFGSDKGTKVKDPYNKNSNKIFGHGFAKFYQDKFQSFQKKKFNLLEIGTWEGASLVSFLKYFENAIIFGLDRNFKLKYTSKRLKYFNCDTTNIYDLNIFKNKNKGVKFKIIIDDGSHLLSDIIHNMKFFSKFLDQDSYYVIEDYNHPKYYSFLNDTNGNEILVEEIIKKLKNKIYFNSSILNKNDQAFLHERIEKIDVYTGSMIEAGKNISNIAFFKFK